MNLWKILYLNPSCQIIPVTKLNREVSELKCEVKEMKNKINRLENDMIEMKAMLFALLQYKNKN